MSLVTTAKFTAGPKSLTQDVNQGCLTAANWSGDADSKRTRGVMVDS